MKIEELGTETPKSSPQFSPDKAYQWLPTDKLSIMGGELNLLKQALEQTLRGFENGQQVVATYESLKVVNELVKRGVEDGIIVEAPTDSQQKELG